MKNRYFKYLLATLMLWCAMASVQAQTNYFRVIKGIPHLPVVANTVAVVAPLPGALVYSIADGTVRLYTGTVWDNLCTTSMPSAINSATYFRVVGGIPCLPVQVAPTGTPPPSGAIAYQTGVGLRINNGTSWKYLADINLQTNIPVNPTTSMGNITGATGGFTIPVLTTAPTGITDGAIYIDATTGSVKIYYNLVWKILTDCNCPPQADAVRIQTVDGMTFYSGYAYYDKEGNPEGASVINWYKSAAASETGRVACGTGNTYTDFVGTDYYLSFTVTPVSTAGATTGSPFKSDYYLVKNCPPQAMGVFVETADNTTFGASYTYSDKEDNAEGASTIEWFTANDALGAGSALLHTGDTYSGVYSVKFNYIGFKVTPKALAGVSLGATMASPWYPNVNCEPQVTGISINGTLLSGSTLKAGYIYYDKDEDTEAVASTTFQWYRATDAIGTGKTTISGATGRSYTLTASDVGKYIGVAVIPMAQAGYSPGSSFNSLNFLKVN